MNRQALPLSAVVILFAAACGSSNGAAANVEDAGCTETTSADGTTTLTCGTTNVSGKAGENGTTCTVSTENDGSEKTTCGTTSATVTNGANGASGSNGRNGTNGKNGANGKAGDAGKNGTNGKPGANGKNLEAAAPCVTFEGDLIVHDALALYEFDELGCTAIDGNLFVIPTTAAIYDLSALHNLTAVTGGVTVSNTFSANLAGLAQLASIGGALTVSSNSNLTDASLPALSSLGADLMLTSNAALTTANYGALGVIPGTFSIAGSPDFATLGLGDLNTAGFVQIDGTLITTLSLPVLATVTSGYEVSLNSVLTTLDFASSIAVGTMGVSITNNPVLSCDQVNAFDDDAVIAAPGQFDAENNEPCPE